MSHEILNEVRYLIEHRSDYLSDHAVLNNIARALSGEIFDPAVLHKQILRRRLNSHDPAHMRFDMNAALQVALGPDTSNEQREKAQQILDAIPATGEVGNLEMHEALEQTLSLLGAAALGTVLRFHMEAGTSMAGPSEITSGTRRMEQMGLTTADLGWPEKILHPFYVDAAAPEDPTLEARLEMAITTWKEQITR